MLTEFFVGFFLGLVVATFYFMAQFSIDEDDE